MGIFRPKFGKYLKFPIGPEAKFHPQIRPKENLTFHHYGYKCYILPPYALDPYYKHYKLIEDHDFHHINLFIEISKIMYLQHIAMYPQFRVWNCNMACTANTQLFINPTVFFSKSRFTEKNPKQTNFNICICNGD